MHHQDLQLFIGVKFVITCAVSSYTIKPDSGVNIAQKNPKNKHSVPSKKNLKKNEWKIITKIKTLPL